MAWCVEHIDAVLMIAFGATASLMGAGILRLSKATLDPSSGRVQKIRRALSILGPILVVIGLMLAFLPAHSHQQEILPTASREQWHEVKGDGKFTIMMPIPPEAKEHAADSPMGRVTVHSYSACPEPKSVDYRIRYTELPSPASFENLPESRHLNLASMRDFKLIGQRSGTVSGYPAEVVEGTGPNGLSIKMEAIWVGSREYVIMRTAQSGAIPLDNQFFSSFRVLSK
jgi:hypothetical protein